MTSRAGLSKLCVAGLLVIGCTAAAPRGATDVTAVPAVRVASRAPRPGPLLAGTLARVPTLAVDGAVPAAPSTTIPPDVQARADFQPGVHLEQAQVGGLTRDWTVVVPPGRRTDRPAPLVVVLHGVAGHGAGMRTLGFEALAAERGAIVAYPEAAGGSWNDGRPGLESISGTLVDDVSFLRTVIDDTASRVGADPRHVVVVGFSNGAMMTSRFACESSDRVVGVALVSGTGPQGLDAACHPSRPLPLLVVFGTGDKIVPYGGGPVASYNGKRRGVAAGVDELLTVWRRADGCGEFASRALPSTAPAVTELRAATCPPGLEVVHDRVEGGAHEWVMTAGFNTTSRVWQFLSPRFDTE